MWWFYTVILGISFGQVLQELAIAVREWAQSAPRSASRSTRARRPFLPAMLWQTFLLVLIVQVWLAVTYYRDTVTRISILELMAFLAVPAGILIMSFLLPEARSQSGSELSGTAAFARVRPIFFGVLVGIVAVNLLHNFLIGEQGLDRDLLFQALIAAGAITGLVLRSTVADSVLAAVMIVVLLTYIGLGYSTVEVRGTDAAAISSVPTDADPVHL